MPTKISDDIRSEILALFDSDLSLYDIADKFNISHQTVQNIFAAVHNKEARVERANRLRRNLRGEKHPLYKGRTVNAKGYPVIYAPDWYQGYKDDRGRAPEHLVKWCEYNNTNKVPDGFVVHHRNEDKTDVSRENLELQSASEHSSTHSARRSRDYLGMFK